MPSLSEFVQNHEANLNQQRERINSIKNVLNELSLDRFYFASPFVSINCPKLTKASLIYDCQITNIKDVSFPGISSHHQSSTHAQTMPKQTVHCPVYNSCFSRLGEYEEKRKKLKDERRHEYNDYLKEKAKLALLRSKQKLDAKVTSFLKTSQLNPLNEISEVNISIKNSSDQEDGHQNVIKENNLTTKSNIFDWTSSDSIYEPIVPKNRLLATKSSKIKAAKYQEELIKQIEEKKEREKAFKEKAKIEEKLLEKKIIEQRKRIFKDYLDEQKRLRHKTDIIMRKQEMVKQPQFDNMKRPSSDVSSTSSNSRNLRSPSYLYIKLPESSKNYKKHTNLASKFGPLSCSERSSPLPKVTENSLLNEKFQEIVNHKVEVAQRKKSDKILTRLSEVRRKVQDDHKKMLDQLREKMMLN